MSVIPPENNVRTVTEVVSGGAGDLAWLPFALSGAPTHDPNSTYDSLTDNGDGQLVFGIDGTTARSNLSIGATWVEDLPAGFVADGTMALWLRIKRELAASQNGSWLALGLCDNGGDPSVGGGVAHGIYQWHGTTLYTKTFCLTRVGSSGGQAQSTSLPHTSQSVVYPGSSAFGSCIANSVEVGDTSATTQNVTYTGAQKLVIGAGMFSSYAGVVTIPGTFEYAIQTL